MGAVIALLAACIFLWIGGTADDPGSTRLWAIFCCLVPSLLMGAAAILGGTRYFGRRR